MGEYIIQVGIEVELFFGVDRDFFFLPGQSVLIVIAASRCCTFGYFQGWSFGGVVVLNFKRSAFLDGGTVFSADVPGGRGDGGGLVDFYVQELAALGF